MSLLSIPSRPQPGPFFEALDETVTPVPVASAPEPADQASRTGIPEPASQASWTGSTSEDGGTECGTLTPADGGDALPLTAYNMTCGVARHLGQLALDGHNPPAPGWKFIAADHIAYEKGNAKFNIAPTP